MYRHQQKDIKRLEELIEKYRYKATKAKMAQSKINYLERMDKIENPKAADTKTFKANFKSRVRGGKNVLSLDHFAFGYDKVLGKGKITKTFKISAPQFSASAIEKIEELGGEAIEL